MDLEIMKKIIKKHIPEHGKFQMEACIAERYYRNETDVLFRKSNRGEEETALRNADNRIPRNFHGLIVNQKSAYAFTVPPVFDVGNLSANKQITKVLGDEYTKNCNKLCINAANTTVGWVHYWDRGEGFEWAVMDSQQVVPIFDSGLKKKLLGVLRTYSEMDETDGEMYAIYEYWTENKCQAFRTRIADITEDGLEYYNLYTDSSTGEPVSEYEHGMEEVPFIPFWNNNINTNDLKNIKPLIDVYDKVFSGFINDLDDVQELIFVLSGYGGTDLREFLEDLKRYKAIKLDADAGENPGLTTLNIEIPIEARNSVLEATRKAIFEQGQGFDPQPENFGNQSGEALKFMYSLLEMKTGLMEIEFRIGFAKLVRAICRHEGLQCDSIIQTWTRTGIRKDTEQAAICRDSVGIVSLKTILKNHPLVQDVEEELKQLKKEEAENQEKMENAFGFKQEKASEEENGEKTDEEAKEEIDDEEE